MASDTIVEFIKITVIAVLVIFFISFSVVAVHNYVTSWQKAGQISKYRESLAVSLQKWSSQTAQGVLNLSAVSASTLLPGTTVKIYYENGTLAKSISK